MKIRTAIGLVLLLSLGIAIVAGTHAWRQWARPVNMDTVREEILGMSREQVEDHCGQPIMIHTYDMGWPVNLTPEELIDFEENAVVVALEYKGFLVGLNFHDKAIRVIPPKRGVYPWPSWRPHPTHGGQKGAETAD